MNDGLRISDATRRNWNKLNTNLEGRLTSRANKRESARRILPIEYFTNKDNITLINSLLDSIDEQNHNIFSVIFSLAINMLRKNNLDAKDHVIRVLSDYKSTNAIDYYITLPLPEDENDFLGLLYQSYLKEGKKNIIGSYYTPWPVVQNMVKDFNLSGQCSTFFDPCCGSGAFLMNVKASTPQQLYGIDNDPIAVFIAKINLIIQYREFEFSPQIFCGDYLSEHDDVPSFITNMRFDYIATNPPWGAMDVKGNQANIITSKESFSYFFVKANEQLKPSGIIKFLFPEAILNVKCHKDIRDYMLNTAKLTSITVYDGMFSGVTTKYVDIECGNKSNNIFFTVFSAGKTISVDKKSIYETENHVFNVLSLDDMTIVKTVKNRGELYLKDSIWALGIVTGDNKNKLFSEPHDGMEAIFTGKEIRPYKLLPPQKFIKYDRKNFQQVAREEIYRADEKLVYKFISNRLVFAYDNSRSLFLNSANILIPNVPNMSVKTVMAFLNSTLFQFIYDKLFGEVKILKGNLMELPFPTISTQENETLTILVDEVLCGNTSKIEDIENYVFSLYKITQEQKDYIRRTIYGKTY